MPDTAASDAAHRQPEIEHFLHLNTILNSLVDFIRPETYVSQEELEAYNELKDKFLREPNSKRNQSQGKSQGQTKKSPLEVAGVQSIRSTSGIYQFLAHHHSKNRSTDGCVMATVLLHLEDNSAAASNKKKVTGSVSRDELLKKLHAKMPHRQQQAGEFRFLVTVELIILFVSLSENGVDPSAKRKRTKEAPQEQAKKPRISTKEWTATSAGISFSS